MTTPVAGFTSHSDASDTDNLYEQDGPPPTTAPSDGDAVQSWVEETGTDVWVFPTATSESPLYRATGMNSTGCLEFDGTDDVLAAFESTISTQQALSTFVSASAFTVVVALTLEASASNAANVYDNEALTEDNGNNWGLYFNTITATHYLRGFVWDGTSDHATPATANAAISLSTDHVAQFRFDSGTMYLSIDGGTEVSTGSVSNIDSLTSAVYLGSAASVDINFKIGEIFYYSTNLGASNDTYTYMREKWLNEGGGSILPQIMHHRRLTEVS